MNYCITCGKMCAQYNTFLPGSFNFNYNYQTGNAITPSLQISNGIACSNCYVFFGASFMVYSQYASSTFMFETKVGGAAGFNVAIAMNNPSFSGSTTFPLIEENYDLGFGFPIGAGFSIYTYFGGLSVTLSGSGSATGTASFGAGYKTEVQVGMKVYIYVFIIHYICIIFSMLYTNIYYLLS